MIVWMNTRAEFVATTELLLQYSEGIESVVAKATKLAGYCRACEGIRQMQVTLEAPNGTWRNLLEGMVCECGLNGRCRSALAVLDEILIGRQFASALVLERLTPFYGQLAMRLPGLIGCEYLGDTVPAGALVEKAGIAVRSENMMAFALESDALDIVMHFDVLEHVPDWRLGLRECWRVLRPGGIMLFTTPFYDGLERNIVRADWQEGKIRYLLPAAYHGNPLSSEGSLVYIHPSWEVFECLTSIGFGSVRMAVCYDPIQGIFSNGCPFPDGHTWPLVFVVTK
jgi:SAM-dependent methyltransferase